MEFIETSIFTKQVLKLLPDSSYRILQSILMLNPGAGAIIKGSGGIRKIRWNLPGAGKRGALLVIYYFDQPETIYMLFMYKEGLVLTSATLGWGQAFVIDIIVCFMV